MKPSPVSTPLRMCVGCRRILPQLTLLRFVRTSGGLVEPDPCRRRGARGAYLCYRAECLTDAVRRGAWRHAFRVAGTIAPETLERVRALIAGGPPDGVRSRSGVFEGGC